MVLEPLFYVVALLSVFVHGMGKAGFGMGLPILAIPMMSLFISPIQALSILVIPLIFMDLITIHRFKGLWNKEILKFIIPFSLLGIVIGTITFQYLSENSLRVILGLIALGFGLNYFLTSIQEVAFNSSKKIGSFWSILSGFTSFSIHAGGLPISNLMTLSRIHPEEIYKWFMEMFIDSSEWVMVPNVFGMGTFADGGIFATKPYSCGSNYLLKMSNYKKGPWCDVVDGLYWKFMSDNKKFFASNPRLSILPRSLDRMKPERKKLIFKEADNFIGAFTAK